MKLPILLIIKIYQFFISPWLGKNCRYFPTCSEYAKDAIINWGALKGVALTLTRLAKCHPFARGGYDPVPLNKKANK